MADSLVGNLVLIKWVGVAVSSLAILLAVVAVIGDAQGPVMRYWLRYCAFLERKLRLMFIWTPGWYVALGQLIA
jgi:tight adherence protein B